METGKLIKAMRKNKGISAEQLADILGVAPSTVYRYENGDIEKMPYKVLLPIAKALGTNPRKALFYKAFFVHKKRGQEFHLPK